MNKKTEPSGVNTNHRDALAVLWTITDGEPCRRHTVKRGATSQDVQENSAVYKNS